MWTVPSKASLHSFGYDDQNEIQHKVLVLWHQWHSALVSCDTKSIINGTIVFLTSRQSKLCATWPFGHLMPLALASVLHAASSIINGTIAFLRIRQLKWGATWFFWSLTHLALMLALHNANSVVNGTTAFLRSRLMKLDATHLFWPCDTIGASIGIAWSQQHQQWHHCILLGQDDWNEVKHDFLVMWPYNVVYM